MVAVYASVFDDGFAKDCLVILRKRRDVLIRSGKTSDGQLTINTRLNAYERISRQHTWHIDGIDGSAEGVSCMPSMVPPMVAAND